jgi:uncharacterized protein (DUF2062 family)
VDISFLGQEGAKRMKKWRRRIKYYLIRLLRQKSGSHSIALGFALGFIPNLFPTFGLGPFLSVAMAKVIRGNMISALLGATLGAWMWPLLFYINYKVGEWVTDREVRVEEIVQENLEGVGGIGWNFIIGAGINSIFVGVLLYIVSFYIYCRYREQLMNYIKRISA